MNEGVSEVNRLSISARGRSGYGDYLVLLGEGERKMGVTVRSKNRPFVGIFSCLMAD